MAAKATVQAKARAIHSHTIRFLRDTMMRHDSTTPTIHTSNRNGGMFICPSVSSPRQRHTVQQRVSNVSTPLHVRNCLPDLLQKPARAVFIAPAFNVRPVE